MEKITAHVVSAAALNENQLFTLKNILSKKTGKQVELSVNTESSLIGGLHISVDGYVIDSTVKKQLRDMKMHLKREEQYEL